MAKAVFQKNQKVWVESVGAWATIDRIVPIWAKGFDEPVRVTYDVGLGREFHAHELKPEDKVEDADGALPGEGWRLMRAKNKWQQEGDCAHHPFPGTYPIVVTDEADWGGWRTPGAEYDRDPNKMERQARLIAMVSESPEDAPPAVAELARRAAIIERYVEEVPAAASPAANRTSDAA